VLAVFAVLIGLFGMHGLAAGTVSMPLQSMAGTMPAQAMPATAAHAATQMELRGDALALTMTGCGMDHEGCVAVVRVEHPLAPPSVITGWAVAANKHGLAHQRGVPARESRGPPSVSLTGLGISRT
jgi:hypothetical protein